MSFEAERPYPWRDGQFLAAVAEKAESISGQLHGDGGNLRLVGLEIVP